MRERVKHRLESWLAERRVNTPDNFADWERDEAFVALALARYPLDMEQARMGAYKGQSARMRLRLIHEGFRLLTNAREEIVALGQAATEALARLEG
jgi:hypothetical protein